MKIMTKILPGFLVLGCGTQLQFDSSQLSKAHDSEAIQKSADSPEEEEIPEEDVGAEMPVVISGSFLTCTPVRFHSHDQLVCHATQPLPGDLIAGTVLNAVWGGETHQFVITAVLVNKGLPTVIKLSASKNTIIKISKSQGREILTLEPNGEVQEVTPETFPVYEEQTPVEALPQPQEVKAEEPKPAEPVQAEESPDSEVTPAEDPPEGDPEAQENPELVTNGSFEADAATTSDSADIGFFQKYTNGITGWAQASGTDIEVQKNLLGHKDYLGSATGHWIELCSTFNSGIKQDVPTEPGKEYELKFYFSARPGIPEAQNKMRLTVEGGTPQNYSQSGASITSPNWTQYTHFFTAGDSQTTITFESTGCPAESSGTWLDQVSVKLK